MKDIRSSADGDDNVKSSPPVWREISWLFKCRPVVPCPLCSLRLSLLGVSVIPSVTEELVARQVMPVSPVECLPGVSLVDFPCVLAHHGPVAPGFFD